ncbi:MAG TPA: TetR/AcrR family transcriptional regulator [Candidatus Limnocylindrales bacterium]|nr:TetR/AcrR family transcriptional regulator [Candidatus Limnocylindrales bacterium]
MPRRTSTPTRTHATRDARRAGDASTTRATGAGHRLTADERRTDVVEVAVRAFASSGLHGTSTEDIARLAGVSQPYLFRLFGTKRDLFIAALDRMFGRLRAEFEDAAEHPLVDLPYEYNPVLAAIGKRYGRLLEDQSLLRLQLHGFAACDDPEIRAFVSNGFSELISLVSERSGVPGTELRTFFAEGMLMNVAAAMQLDDSELAWGQICEGVPESTS